MFGILGLIFAIAIFIFISFKGWNIIFSVVSAMLIVCITNGMNFLSALQRPYATGFSDFIIKWWIMFVLGAVFGKVMQEYKFSSQIAYTLSKLFGNNAILVILVISLILSYGGIGTFIIAFTVYPIAYEMFCYNKINMNILPATILFCPTTLCMTMLPGTPAIQNIIPTKYLGTDIYAAPIVGLVASIICFGLGYAYLNKQSKKICKNIVEDEKVKSDGSCFENNNLSVIIPFIPCICLWCVSFCLIKSGLDSQIAVEIAIFIGIIAGIVIGRGSINIKEQINAGIKNGVQTVMITSCIMGFGNVVKETGSFKFFMTNVFDFDGHPIIASIVIINIIAAITGSSTGSLQVFFDNFAGNIATNTISNDYFHRIITIASGGLDSMPYATGVVVTNELAKISMKKTYIHIFVTCAVIPLITLCMILVPIVLLN